MTRTVAVAVASTSPASSLSSPARNAMDPPVHDPARADPRVLGFEVTPYVVS
jgi:hypothetical protein